MADQELESVLNAYHLSLQYSCFWIGVVNRMNMEHFDFERVKEYFGGDAMILQNFLSLLQKELPKSLHELEQRFAEKDLKGIKDASHKLKGTGLSAGLGELTGIASKLNRLDAFGQAHIGGLIEALRNEIAIILPLIEKAKNNF